MVIAAVTGAEAGVRYLPQSVVDRRTQVRVAAVHVPVMQPHSVADVPPGDLAATEAQNPGSPVVENANAKAETCFQEMSTQEFNPGELLHYFQVRKQADEKQFQRMTHTDVRDWQQGLRRFAGKFYEDGFQQWKQTQILPQKLKATSTNCGNQFGTFLINF